MTNRYPAIPVEPEELDGLMEFDHVVRVEPGGFVNDHWELHAPDVFQWLNEDGDAEGEPIIEQLPGGGWSFFSTGYSGQYGYSGPVMHNSEFIGGRLAQDILAVDVPTLFVATAVYCTGGPDEDEFDGWVVLYKEL